MTRRKYIKLHNILNVGFVVSFSFTIAFFHFVDDIKPNSYNGSRMIIKNKKVFFFLFLLSNESTKTLILVEQIQTFGLKVSYQHRCLFDQFIEKKASKQKQKVFQCFSGPEIENRLNN